jgi:hypothetical protein
MPSADNKKLSLDTRPFAIINYTMGFTATKPIALK